MASRDGLAALEGRQLLSRCHHEMSVTCSGGSLLDVSNNLFQLIRKRIYQEVNHPIIQMRTEQVRFESIACSEHTEHFLFVFWPRIERTYRAVAHVTVVVDYLDITEEGQ